MDVGQKKNLLKPVPELIYSVKLKSWDNILELTRNNKVSPMLGGEMVWYNIPRFEELLR